MNNNSSDASKLPVTIALFILMIALGVSFNMIGPLMPDLLEHYGLTMAEGGSIVSVQNLAGLVAVLFCGMFGDRLNKKVFIAVGIGLFVLSLLSIGGTPPFSLLLAIFFVFGLGSRAFDTLSNAVISDLHGPKRSLYLNMLHMFFSLGAFLGPLFIFTAKNALWPWQRSFVVLGVFVALAFIVYLATAFRGKPVEPKTAEKNGMAVVKVFAQPKMWALGLIIFIHMGVQGVLITWLPLFTSGSMSGGSFISNFALSVFWVGVILSRSLLSRLSVKFGEIALIRWGSLAAILAFIPALFIGNPVLLTLSTGLMGLFIGFTIPFLMSVGCGWYPEKSAAVTSMLLVFGYFSIVVYPWLSGLLGDAYGLMAAMALVVVSQAVLFAVSWLLPGNENAE